jgi:small multidrug resistance family-3 protein
MTGRSIALFAAAVVAEITGAYLMWIGIREGEGPLAIAAGAILLALYGSIAAQQPGQFGRVLAAYGGVFVIGSLLWAVAFDRFRPSPYDLAGALICLIGVGLIMYAPH